MKHLRKVIDQALDAGKVIGTSIIIAQHGDVIFETHSGWADCEAKKSVTENTIFRLASLTKPLTSSATFALIEKGLLSLDTSIMEWLPHFTPKAPDGKIYPITIRHLLTHTSGLSYGFYFPHNEPYRSAGVSDGMENNELTLEENVARLAAVPLMFKPGEQWRYSLGIDVLGAVLEKVTGKPLSQVIEQYVTEPLGMKDTSFYVKESRHLATAYFDNSNGGEACLMSAEQKVPIENAGDLYFGPDRILNPRAYPSGGGGMASTARDYLQFLEAIRQGGAPILNQTSIACLTQDAVPGYEVALPWPGYGFGMGFGMIRDAEVANSPRSVGSYEWSGAYGNNAFVDPAIGLSVVILTNTAFYGLKEFALNVPRAVYCDLGLEK